MDKELRIFTITEGGSQNVAADDPDLARRYITDGFADLRRIDLRADPWVCHRCNVEIKLVDAYARRMMLGC